MAAYTAAKHGVLGLVRAAAAEVARTGVTVNAVCPGYVDTPMTDATVAAIAARTGRSRGRGARRPGPPAADRPADRPGRGGRGGGVLPGQRGGHRSGDQRRRRDGPVMRALREPSGSTPRSWPGRRASRTRCGPPERSPCTSPGRPRWTATAAIVGDGVVGQFEQALGNLLTALRAAGGGPEHLASLTIYIVDVPDYRAHAREIGRVWQRLAGRDYPAMAGIGVARLWDDDALVELQGTAELPAG